MRDYSKVSGAFWTGKTGRAIRGDMHAQLVAMYLLTSPHANMIGVFNCPLVYIAHETGMSIEGASKGLQRLRELGFCTYDEDSEIVWVHKMAKFQIGDELKPGDNQVKGIRKQYENLAEGPIKLGFLKEYKQAFHLIEGKPLTTPSEDPSKPGTGTGEGAEEGNSKDSEKNKPALDDAEKKPRAARSGQETGTRLPADWVLPKKWGDWALEERKDFTPEIVRKEAEKFRDHWHANANRREGKKADWLATWRNWVRNVKLPKDGFAAGQAGNGNKPWFITANGIQLKGDEAGIPRPRNDAEFPVYKARVHKHYNITDADLRQAEIDYGARG
jgi:hypothetical protein